MHLACEALSLYLRFKAEKTCIEHIEIKEIFKSVNLKWLYCCFSRYIWSYLPFNSAEFPHLSLLFQLLAHRIRLLPLWIVQPMRL